MSYADLAAAAHLSAVDYLGDVPWNEDEAAKNWYARVKSRPVVPSAAGRDAGRASRRRRPTPISTSERPAAAQDARSPKRAREHGFDVVGVTRPDAIPLAPRAAARSSSPTAPTATWTGWRRRRRGAAIRARCGREVRSVIMLGLNYGAGRRSARDPAATRPRRDLGLRAGRRLSRPHQAAAQGAGALARRAGRRRRQGVRRHRRR